MEDGLRGDKMVFITAEIGINHNGSLKIAKQLIDVAKDAGCDAVKFQKRTVENVYPKDVLDSFRESPWGETTREQKEADMRAIAIGERTSGEKAERHREKDMIKKYGELLSDGDREIERLRKENNDLKNSKSSSSSIFSFTKGA